MRIFNSLIVPENLKEGTLWDFFNISSGAKYQNKLKGGPFGEIKKFSEKKSQPKKGRSLTVPKK